MRTKNPSYITRRRRADGTLEEEWTFVAPGSRKSRKLRGYTSKADAAAAARKLVAGLRSEQRERFEAMLEECKWRRTCCSIGDIAERMRDDKELTRKSRKDERKLLHNLYRVLALALDLWIEDPGPRSGIRPGQKVPDGERIDKLPATVLNAETVKKYFMASLGVESLNWRTVYDGAYSINSRLSHARGIFQGLTKRVKLAGLALPDLAGFLEGRLRCGESRPEPVEAEEFKRVVECFEQLRETRRDLWLCNLVIRQTGMRSLSSAMQIQRSWLRRIGSEWWLDVEGKTSYSIPITEELAGEIEASGQRTADGYLFEGSASQRAALLDEHTSVLKGIIGAGTGGQVNHRLRDTVASAVYHWLGIEAAREALGHTDAKTTRAHYARRMEVSALMKHELRAWKAVLPGNVLELAHAA